MDIWKILEIEPTKDKKSIKKAYRVRLPFVNPEDDQEAFMELREAYEAALEYAEREDDGDSAQPEEDNSEAGLFRKALEALYWDFPRRIDPQQWKDLFACDFASALDTKNEARDIVLTFMLERYLVPCDVVRVMDFHFGLMESKEELFELYPEAFVQQAVLNAIEGTDTMPFELFEVDDPQGIEDFFGRYRKVIEHIIKKEWEDAALLIQTIEDSGVNHPYLMMRKAEVMAASGDMSLMEELEVKLQELYPENIDILLFCGHSEQKKGRFMEAKSFFDKVLEKIPEHADAKFEGASCLISAGSYAEGKEILVELSKEFPTSEPIVEKLKEAGAAIAAGIEAKVADGTADGHDMYELADCYTDMERFEEALEVLESARIPDDKEIKAAIMHVVLLLNLSRFEDAVKYVEQYEGLIEKHHEEDRKKYLSKLLYFKAGAYNSLGLESAERSVLERLVEKTDPEYALGWAALARCQLDKGFYQKGLDCALKGIESDPSIFESYFEAGRACYELGDSNRAISYLAEARDMEPFFLKTHIYIIKSLLDQHRADDAEDYLQYLDENKATGLDLEYLRGRLEILRGNEQQAADIVKNVIEKAKALTRAERREEVSSMGEMYNTLGNLYVGSHVDFEEILELVKEGLKYEGGFGPLLQLKGNLLYDLGRYQEALEEYKRVAARYPQHNQIYWDMGCCHEMMQDYEKALKAYTTQLERKTGSNAYNSCARVAMAMGKLDLAESYLNKAMETDDTDPVISVNMGRLLERRKQPDEALKAYAKARELGKTYNINCRPAYRNAADIYTRKQQGDEAIALIEDLYSQYGQAGDLKHIHLLAQIFGKVDLAFSNLERWAEAAGVDKESFSYQSKYAEILRLADQPEKAVQICERFIDEAPGSCFFGGNLYYNMGDYENALRIFTRGMEVCPEEKKNFLGAAKSAFRLGRREKAAEYARAGLDTYPEDRYAEPGDFFLQDEVVYGALLALSGDFTGGIDLVEKEMWGEMCKGCHYRECIDAYIELSDMYDFVGDKEKALEMAEKGCLVSEFDFDLISERKRLKEELKC